MRFNDMSQKKIDLYNDTVKRLVRFGAKDPASQIIALAEEIERYRETIKSLWARHSFVMVIRCNACMKQEHLAELRRLIVAQAEEGVIVLPSYCELLTTAPEGVEILVEGQEG